jgi:hypothetical protein
MQARPSSDRPLRLPPRPLQTDIAEPILIDSVEAALENRRRLKQISASRDGMARARTLPHRAEPG